MVIKTSEGRDIIFKNNIIVIIWNAGHSGKEVGRARRAGAERGQRRGEGGKYG